VIVDEKAGDIDEMETFNSDDVMSKTIVTDSSLGESKIVPFLND
jgi:hypothetical protein